MDEPGGDSPGRELPQDFREVAIELVRNQGWRYDNGRRRGGHPLLLPADRTKRPIAVPTTPGDVRSLRNFKATVRQAGGIWPPPRKR